MRIAKHFLISGKVQGVFFRASTQGKALTLGLTGWVRNLPDGRVEVLAGGDEAAMLEFEQWLRQGPEQAQVERVEAESELYQHFVEFTVR